MLEGKVVVVTGAGRGIGREIALAMAREGAAVVVNDIGASLGGEGKDTSPAETVVADIRAAGGTAEANTDSIADWDGAHRLIDQAVAEYGRLDCLVNNAGILRDIIFHKMTRDDWEAVIQVNLNGAFYCSSAAAQQFRRQQSGAYVHLISASALAGNIGQANYSAAKAGMAALSKSIALDMERFNVRSNCIAPSAWTRMTGSIPTDDAENRARVAQRMKVTPDKNAPMAVFLASDAARDVTGQIFATRMNEIFLMGQSRPLRGIHRSEGWSPQTIADHAIPALRSQFYPLDKNQDLYPHDPV